MRIPKGRFELTHISLTYPNSRHVWKYIVTLNGIYSRVWCDHKVRTREEALRHFWRFIGES